MHEILELHTGALGGAPMGSDEIYDVYSVFALLPEVVESPFFRSFHYLVLLSAFIGVPTTSIGVSRTLRLPEQ